MPRLSVVHVLPMSTAKAWLLGFLAADSGFEYEPGKIYRVTAHLGDPELLDEVLRSFKESYEGIVCTPGVRYPGQYAKTLLTKPYHYVRVAQKTVVEDLLSLAPFGVGAWRAPSVVRGGSKEIKAAWVRGYFDGDGGPTCDLVNKSRYVEATSIHKAGRNDVSEILDSLGIHHSRLQRPERKNGAKSYQVRISYHEDVDRFTDVVGSASTSKTAVLARARETRERFPVRKSTVRDLVPEITRRRKAGETHAEIGAAVGIKTNTVWALCRRLGIKPETEGRGRINKPRGSRARLLPEIVRLRAEGFGGQEIAERLGLSHRKEVDDIVKYWGRKATK